MAEAAVLGALLANNRAREQCLILQPSDFSVAEYEHLFARITSEIDMGRRVDAVSLRGHFDEAVIAGVAASMVSLMIEPYVREIQDCAARRQLIDVAAALATEAFAGGTTLDSLLNAAARIDALASGASAGSGVSFGGAVEEALASLGRAQERDAADAVSTGFRSIDERLGGLEDETLTIIAARPGMGKTGLACNLALNVAQAGIPVIVFSLEMSRLQLARRVLASLSRIPVIAIKRGRVNVDDTGRLVAIGKLMGGLPLWIEDASGVAASQIAARVRVWRRKVEGRGLVIVDHLHIVRPEGTDIRAGATYAVGQVSGALKRISKASRVPVVALAQLNRGVEGREDKRPGLADLRASGDIEQDADSVGFIYRAEYYLGSKPERGSGESEFKYTTRVSEWETERERAAGRADLIWAKVRDGSPGTDALRFDAMTASFSEVNSD